MGQCGMGGVVLSATWNMLFLWSPVPSNTTLPNNSNRTQPKSLGLKVNKWKCCFIKISIRHRAHTVLLLFSSSNRPKQQVGTEGVFLSSREVTREAEVREMWQREKTIDACLGSWLTYRWKDDRMTWQISAVKRHPWRTKIWREDMVASHGGQETSLSEAWGRIMDSTY